MEEEKQPKKKSKLLADNPERAKEIGRLGGLAKKGKKHKRTLIKEALSISQIDDLKTIVLQNFTEAVHSKDKREKLEASIQLAKYLFPQKRLIAGKFEGDIKVNIEY